VKQAPSIINQLALGCKLIMPATVDVVKEQTNVRNQIQKNYISKQEDKEDKQAKQVLHGYCNGLRARKNWRRRKYLTEWIATCKLFKTLPHETRLHNI